MVHGCCIDFAFFTSRADMARQQFMFPKMNLEERMERLKGRRKMREEMRTRKSQERQRASTVDRGKQKVVMRHTLQGEQFEEG